MPFQSDYDKASIKELAAEFDIDFVALTYTCSAQDVADLRSFLDSSGLRHTSIMAKVQVTACTGFAEGSLCALAMPGAASGGRVRSSSDHPESHPHPLTASICKYWVRSWYMRCGDLGIRVCHLSSGKAVLYAWPCQIWSAPAQQAGWASCARTAAAGQASHQAVHMRRLRIGRAWRALQTSWRLQTACCSAGATWGWMWQQKRWPWCRR